MHYVSHQTGMLNSYLKIFNNYKIMILIFLSLFFSLKIFRYWLCVATGQYIRIWDLEGKEIVCELKPEIHRPKHQNAKKNVNEKNDEGVVADCISLAWSADGHTLYSGYTDNKVRVWKVQSNKN